VAPVENVLWVGGAQWAGKSTVAMLLTARYPLLRYAYDYHDARSPRREIAQMLKARTGRLAKDEIPPSGAVDPKGDVQPLGERVPDLGSHLLNISKHSPRSGDIPEHWPKERFDARIRLILAVCLVAPWLRTGALCAPYDCARSRTRRKRSR
jgi:hypothetical protein